MFSAELTQSIAIIPYNHCQEGKVTTYVADHPLIKHKLGLIRKKNQSTKDFRDLSSEIARLLTYEATKDLETEKQTI